VGVTIAGPKSRHEPKQYTAEEILALVKEHAKTTDHFGNLHTAAWQHLKPVMRDGLRDQKVGETKMYKLADLGKYDGVLKVSEQLYELPVMQRLVDGLHLDRAAAVRLWFIYTSMLLVSAAKEVQKSQVDHDKHVDVNGIAVRFEPAHNSDEEPEPVAVEDFQASTHKNPKNEFDIALKTTTGAFENILHFNDILKGQLKDVPAPNKYQDVLDEIYKQSKSNSKVEPHKNLPEKKKSSGGILHSVISLRGKKDDEFDLGPPK